MRQSFKQHYEKFLVIFSAGALACSMVWARRQLPRIESLREPGKGLMAQTADDYVPAAWRIPAAEPVTWSAPTEQSAGKGWRYDLFTPPAIYYDQRARTFAVTPFAETASDPDETSEADEETGDEPFPLQLAGYFGSPDDYVVAFVATESAGVVMSRVGRRFEEWGLTLKSFEVRKVPVETDEAGPVYEVAGFATLVDDTGTEVVLDTRARKPAPDAVAPLNPSMSRTRDVANNGP